MYKRQALDEEVRAFAAAEGLPYVRDDDSIRRPFTAPPLVVNYFFHEEIILSLIHIWRSSPRPPPPDRCQAIPRACL